MLTRFKASIPPANERKKLLPLALIFFCNLFNYTILRDTKDVLMVTARGSGAEVIPFLKTYVTLPSAISFTVLYSKMTDRMSQKNVYQTIVVSFLLFFASFAFILYPASGFLHPHTLCDWLAAALPAGFSAPIAILRNWTYAMFYVLAEMWGSVVVSLLFWGFANSVTSLEEAKKYYPLFGLGANVALIFSGQYVKLVSKVRSRLPPGTDAWGVSLKLLIGAVLMSGSTMLATYRHMQKNVLTDPNCVLPRAPSKKKKKVKMGMRESFKFLAASPYIRNLATLVVSYGMCINIVEVSWKSKLKLAYPNPSDYSAFMGNFSSTTGAVTLVMMLIGRKIFSKFGWRTAALVTPTMIGVTGLSFFALTLFPTSFAPSRPASVSPPSCSPSSSGPHRTSSANPPNTPFSTPARRWRTFRWTTSPRRRGRRRWTLLGTPSGRAADP